jgi:hypothetical protein
VSGGKLEHLLLLPLDDLFAALLVDLRPNHAETIDQAVELEDGLDVLGRFQLIERGEQGLLQSQDEQNGFRRAEAKPSA